MKARPILFSGAMVRALLASTKTQTRRIIKPQPHHGPVGTMVHLGDGGWAMDDGDLSGHWQCPYGDPGDLLIVRETFRLAAEFDDRKPTLARPNSPVHYEADGRADEGWGKTRVSIHMPRWASRMTLEITEVRVERLQDISESDAVAEGIYRSTPDDEDRAWFHAYREEQTSEPPSQADLDQFNEGVWKAPGIRQGWGSTQAERDQDQWFPNAPGAYGLLWKAINGPESWDANPWVWAISFKVYKANIDDFLKEDAA